MHSYARLLAIAFLLSPAHAAHGQAADTITDARDGYRYPVVRVGGLRWFAENLRYRTSDSRCYENDHANCEDHGRLYRLEDALKACPAGWRVPSEEDWRALERGLGMPDAEIGKEDGRGAPAGRRLKFGGDTDFNVRYSGWIDPHLADSSRAMGRNAATGHPLRGRRTRSRRRCGTAMSPPTGTRSGGRRAT